MCQSLYHCFLDILPLISFSWHVYSIQAFDQFCFCVFAMPTIVSFIPSILTIIQPNKRWESTWIFNLSSHHLIQSCPGWLEQSQPSLFLYSILFAELPSAELLIFIGWPSWPWLFSCVHLRGWISFSFFQVFLSRSLVILNFQLIALDWLKSAA